MFWSASSSVARLGPAARKSRNGDAVALLGRDQRDLVFHWLSPSEPDESDRRNRRVSLRGDVAFMISVRLGPRGGGAQRCRRARSGEAADSGRVLWPTRV